MHIKYVYIYIYINKSLSLSIYICMRVYIYIYIYMYIYLCVYIHVRRKTMSPQCRWPKSAGAALLEGATKREAEKPEAVRWGSPGEARHHGGESQSMRGGGGVP